MEDIIGFCLRHELTPSQFMTFQMKLHSIIKYHDINEYSKSVFSPTLEDIKILVDKNIFITNTKIPTMDSCIVNPRMKEVEYSSREEMADELWNRYPGAFPLGDGGMFIARKGPDKHDVLKLYLERINYSEEKHKFVLKQLENYTKLVLDRKINGHRIHDWISNEMWDIIPALQLASTGEFKTDI